jgi:hypothetical protein
MVVAHSRLILGSHNCDTRFLIAASKEQSNSGLVRMGDGRTAAAQLLAFFRLAVNGYTTAQMYPEKPARERGLVSDLGPPSFAMDNIYFYTGLELSAEPEHLVLVECWQRGIAQVRTWRSPGAVL